MSIETLLDKVIGTEGGYVNHPSDRGGPTRWGITEQVARAHGYNGTMQTLPRDVAKNIYRQMYWTRPGFDAIATVYPKLAEELFDIGVNMGPKTAAMFLQHILNAMNSQEKSYPDIAADGDIGPMTVHVLQQFKAKRGAQGETVMLRAVDSLQGARYIAITDARKKNEDFTYGWFANRVGGF